MLTKNDIMHRKGYLVKNRVLEGEENSTSMPPDQKVNKAEYIYISRNIGYLQGCFRFELF
jgi:hypothetical protein